MRYILAIMLIATPAIAQEKCKGWDAPISCILGSKTGTNTITLSTTSTTGSINVLNYVKAAAIIDWYARQESGDIRAAMELAAEQLTACANIKDSRGFTSSLPSIPNCR